MLKAVHPWNIPLETVSGYQWRQRSTGRIVRVYKTQIAGKYIAARRESLSDGQEITEKELREDWDLLIPGGKIA